MLFECQFVTAGDHVYFWQTQVRKYLKNIQNIKTLQNVKICLWNVLLL